MPAGAPSTPSSPEVETSICRWLDRTRNDLPVAGLEWKRRAALFAFFGLVMGTLFDALHVWTWTARYEDTCIVPVLRVAWYVPFEFMAGGITVGLARPAFDEEFRRRPARLSRPNVLRGLRWFGVAWFLSGVLTPVFWLPDHQTLRFAAIQNPNHVICAVLGLIAAGTWFRFDRTHEGVGVAFVTAGIGVGIEIGLVKLTSTYRYLHPDCLGVPIWLPFLYLIACGSVGNLARFVKYPSESPVEPVDEPATPVSDAA